jgi:hypothetical protein
MSKAKKEPLVYYLQEPVEYTVDGGFEKAEMLELYEFGAHHRPEYLRLRSMVRKVFVELGERVENKNRADGEQAVDDVETRDDDLEEGLSLALDVSKEIDPEQFLKCFERLIMTPHHSLCKVDGRADIKNGTWATISPDDQFNIAVKYCVYFGIGLAFLKKNG